MTLTSHHKVNWVHGFFWHRYAVCDLARTPKTNLEFWLSKLVGNKERDKRNQLEIERMGW